MFITGKILAALAFPPGLFLVLGAFAIILAILKRRKSAIVVAIGSLVLLSAMSTNAFASLVIAPFENAYPAYSGGAGEAKAIVVLGGGYSDNSPEYSGAPALSQSGMKRAVFGYELYVKLKLPLLFSEGKGYDMTTPATGAQAAERLWLALGVPSDRLLLESASVDTRTNAAGTAARFKGKPVILVTSAFHMPRSMLSFRRAGMQPIPAPTDYLAKRTPLTWPDFLPSPGALETSTLALHEAVGLLWYLVRP